MLMLAEDLAYLIADFIESKMDEELERLRRFPSVFSLLAQYHSTPADRAVG